MLAFSLAIVLNFPVSVYLYCCDLPSSLIISCRAIYLPTSAGSVATRATSASTALTSTTTTANT
eukprot:1374906-Amorphochlora_amoeboformis.AAC.1